MPYVWLGGMCILVFIGLLVAVVTYVVYHGFEKLVTRDVEPTAVLGEEEEKRLKRDRGQNRFWTTCGIIVVVIAWILAAACAYMAWLG